MSLVVHNNWELEQMDVTTAFLHGELEEQIYMRQPEGFEEDKENKVCLLKKSLYGLKQSPRQLNKKFHKFMCKIGYLRSNYDYCVYMNGLRDSDQIILLLYVDDILIAGKNVIIIQALKKKLSSEFEMKDMGAVKRVLGIDIQRDRRQGTIFMT